MLHSGGVRVLILVCAFAVVPAMAQQPIFAPGTVINAPGSYVVVSNLVTVPFGPPAITIAAGVSGHVEINLLGFTLNYQSNFVSPAILNNSAAVVLTVRNGNIRGGTASIQSLGGAIVVEDIKTSLGSSGLNLTGMVAVTLRGNTFAGGNGLTITGLPPMSANIENNIIQVFLSPGISIVNGSSVSIRNNQVDNVGAASNSGILLTNTVNAQLVGNAVSNFATGIGLLGSSGAELRNNTVSACSNIGISLDTASNDNRLMGNSVTGTVSGGGISSSGLRNVLDGNLSNGNGDWGIRLNGATVSNIYRNNTGSGNCPGGVCVVACVGVSTATGLCVDSNANIDGGGNVFTP